MREIGSAFVRLFVKKDGLSAGLKSAENEVKQSADNMAASAANAGAKASAATGGVFAGLKDIRKSLNDTVGVVLSLIARFTAVLAVLGLVVAAAKSLHEWLNKSKHQSDELGQSVELMRKSVDDLIRGGDAYTRAIDAAAAQHTVVFNALEKEKLKLDEIKKSFESGFDPTGEVAAQVDVVDALSESLKTAKTNVDRLRKARADRDAAQEEEKAKDDAAKRADANEKFRLDLFYKYRRELDAEFWANYHKKQEEAHAARMDQIERETREQEEAQRRLQGLMSSQRNQSASGDIKTMISLLKVLVDK